MGVALSPAYGGNSPKGGAFRTKPSEIPFPDKCFPAVLRLPLWGSSAKR